MPRLGSKAAVVVPALTDKHTITQGGVDYSETNTQILALLNDADYSIHTITVGLGSGDVASNTIAGVTALNSNTTGAYNTAVGYEVLKANTTGANNTAIGYQSLNTNTIGYSNTSIGDSSLKANTTGNYNTAVGHQSLETNISGYGNVAIGFQSMYDNTSGYRNIAIGFQALANNTTGTYNTVVGYGAGIAITTGSNLTCIGNQAAASSATATNEITLGNASITSLRCAVTSITAISDERDKTNIQGLAVGLDFIMKLQPKTFQWNKREWYNGINDGSKIDKDIQMGLIAQDVIQIEDELGCNWMKIVNRENTDKYEMSIGKIIMPLVLAVQELKKELDILKNA